MGRVCVRPGCDRPARARLAYDTVTCQVWLDQLPERSGRSQEICELHAERLTVPRGWMLCDRRAEAPALFVAEVVATTDGSPEVSSDGGTTRPRRRPRRDPDSTRNLFDEIAADMSEAPIEVMVAPHLAVVDVGHDSTAPPIEPAPVEPAPVEPAAEIRDAMAADDAVDDLPVLQATSPLLARAFRQTGPQRSVLTQTGGDESATD